MWICPSFAVRPSLVSQLSQNLFGGFLSNFSRCLAWAIRPDVFEFVKKKTRFPIFHNFLLTWDPVERKRFYV